MWGRAMGGFGGREWYYELRKVGEWTIFLGR
jgi:hypothetical protein